VNFKKHIWLIVSIIIGIILCSNLSLKAQTPSFFKLGEEELSGVDIYDILQDIELNYWLATDNGLIKYDGYSFVRILAKEALSNSVFDLKLDYNNNLFCMNLSGQIFQIINDSCKVHFQIPDSLMYKNVHYAFNSNNELIIATNSLFRVNEDKSIFFYKNKYNSYTDLLTLKDSTLLLYSLSNSLLTKIKGNNITGEEIYTDSNFLFLNFLLFDNKLQYYNKVTSEFLIKNKNTFIVNNGFSPAKNKDERLRYYAYNRHLWVARQAGGIKAFNKDYQPIFGNSTVFSNNIISTVFKDNEGSTIMGTFGDGLIVIPNVNLIDVNTTEKEVKYTRVASVPNNVFLGTQNGTVLQLDSNYNSTVVWARKNKNIELLEFLKESNTLLIDGNNTFLLDLKTKNETRLNWGSIKDVLNVSENNYLFASSSGVYKFNALNFTYENNPIGSFNSRTNCVGFDDKTKTIFAGTTSGLKIGNEKTANLFLLDGSPVICRDILSYRNVMYVTTQKHGVLIFENNKLINNWNIKSGFPTNNLKHIKEYNNQFYISTDKGIIITNIDGDVLFVLNKSEGVYTNRIIDFEVTDNVIWLVHQKGVQRINLKEINPFSHTPTIAITDLLVNDSIKVVKDNTTYTYQQNKFEFYISSSSTKYKDEIQYLHQLEGIDNAWQTNPYENNKIEYKSLPPGDYVFRLKAKCRGKESTTIVYAFSISPPFWNTWWFYLLLVVFFITVTVLVYKHEIKKQRKKIKLENELNASKLIAIQSQMNPHFIFNAINSIQDLILKGDIDNSYSYIIKFSKLVRQTLNFSDKEFIDIEDEIELLEIYLELEKLRFKDDFEYTINCEVTDIQVPPMLVQPFVENAIKHGLLHKEGLKKLAITFKKDEILYCSVIDNGIGRKKALEIKARQQKNHQSFSVSATKSRFEIMKSHYKKDLGIQFEDLLEDNKPAGTKVLINMPFKQNY